MLQTVLCKKKKKKKKKKIPIVTLNFSLNSTRIKYVSEEKKIFFLIVGHPGTLVQRSKKKPRESARAESPILGHRDKATFKDRGPGGHRSKQILRLHSSSA